MNIDQNPFLAHARLFRVLGNPKRLEILHLLRHKPLTVLEIASMLDLPQANLSQHLSVMRDAKILTTTRCKNQITYTLSSPLLADASDAFRDFLNSTDLPNLVVPVIDPVCQMKLTPLTASFQYTYLGKPYYFCASKCRHLFINHPHKYL